jgi:hypothetical protein
VAFEPAAILCGRPPDGEERPPGREEAAHGESACEPVDVL